MSDPFAEAALLMADSRYALGREYSAPLGDNTAARLELPRGAAHLTLRGDADLAMLFQPRFGSPMADVIGVPPARRARQTRKVRRADPLELQRVMGHHLHGWHGVAACGSPQGVGLIARDQPWRQ